MFWIHSGSFAFGSGAVIQDGFNIYDETQLALKRVIVVSINYRLGIFGLLYANRSDCTGNMAFWDQALALKWTKNNIRSFGGNPKGITVFGESAGNISISNLIISPITRNSFKKVIMLSGLLYFSDMGYQGSKVPEKTCVRAKKVHKFF
jgi:carboxylesterase type B